MQLDFSSLQKGLQSLKRAMDRAQEQPSDDVLRDAVIQRYEYSYELTWKMLKRQLEQEVPDPSEMDRLSFKDLLREAVERGFPVKFDNWVVYRAMRNITSQTYDESKAEEVYQVATEFYDEALALLISLEERSLD